jgi:hypothetical protein
VRTVSQEWEANPGDCVSDIESTLETQFELGRLSVPIMIVGRRNLAGIVQM